jgi:16S rRNA (adenine1518-N6/adenine1519-N6)-dimethyltransferase
MKNLAKPEVIKELLRENGFHFSKSLGQNFLTDENVLQNIVDSACPEEKGVLEIGPGFGSLTQRLCQRAKKVVSVEIDSAVIPILEDNLKECENFKLIHGDIMKEDLTALCQREFGDEKIKVCANLPYYITSPVILRLLDPDLPIEDITIMIQKEVAERINAKAGSKDYGVLTLTVGYYASSEIVCIVPPSAFMPPPKVSSAVIKLTLRDKPPVEVKNTDTYFAVIKAAFALRRKTLLNALGSANLGKSKDEILAILEKSGIDPKRRGETLTDEEFARIANKF